MTRQNQSDNPRQRRTFRQIQKNGPGIRPGPFHRFIRRRGAVDRTAFKAERRPRTFLQHAAEDKDASSSSSSFRPHDRSSRPLPGLAGGVGTDPADAPLVDLLCLRRSAGGSRGRASIKCARSDIQSVNHPAPTGKSQRKISLAGGISLEKCLSPVFRRHSVVAPSKSSSFASASCFVLRRMPSLW